jgi:hypothetical protein
VTVPTATGEDEIDAGRASDGPGRKALIGRSIPVTEAAIDMRPPGFLVGILTMERRSGHDTLLWKRFCAKFICSAKQDRAKTPNSVTRWPQDSLSIGAHDGKTLSDTE